MGADVPEFVAIVVGFSYNTITAVFDHFPDIVFAVVGLDVRGTIVTILVSAVGANASDIIVPVIGFGDGGITAIVPSCP